jgi:DNA-binding beta-propeller fold protein YncE
LSPTLATGAASLLAAVPAQAADIYTVTAKIGIGVGPYPDSAAVSPDGTRAYIVSTVNDSVSVINTRTGHHPRRPLPGGCSRQPSQPPGLRHEP